MPALFGFIIHSNTSRYIHHNRVYSHTVLRRRRSSNFRHIRLNYFNNLNSENENIEFNNTNTIINKLLLI